MDGLWAQALVPISRALAALADAQRDLRRYRRYGQQPGRLTERVERLRQDVDHARETEALFEAEYDRRGGWTRYFLFLGQQSGAVNFAAGGLLSRG